MPMQMPPTLYEPISLKGGLDLITPTLNLPPGVCRDSVNYEAVETGGYARIAGYERFSGQSKPSDAVFGLVFLASFTNPVSVGDTITNGVATGVVIAVTTSYIVFTKLAGGTFAVGDSILVGATPIGTMITPTSAIGAKLTARYTALAADNYRADISKPAGSGRIRSVFVYNDIAYCIRDNAGATAAVLFKQTTSGWTAVTLFNEVSFTAGAVATPADGAILTQGANTATVKRVVTETGAWTGTAAGRFIVTTPAPGAFVAGAATLSGGATVTLSGAQTAITLSPGGKGEAVQANFFGQASGTRIYHADGVNRLFEFDGTTLVPISTGGLIPRHVVVHLRYLFYSVNSSIFYQGVGNPYSATGGGELATGDTVVGFLVMPGSQTTGTLAVLNRNSTNMLYGTAPASWNMTPYNSGTGALEYTTQNMAQSCLLDDRGVFTLQTSLNYGNFEQNSLSHQIRPFITAHRPYVSCSGLNRLKSQYRVFYSDGWALYVTLVNNKLIGCMPMYFPVYANVTWESTLSTGANIMLMGGSDGHVYELDQGTSFDGTAIAAYITLNWDAIKNPRILKSYRKGAAEISGSSYVEVNFGYSLGYASADVAQADSATYPTPFSPAYWDAFTWDSFTWDGRNLAPTECEMEGIAENVQISIASNSTDYEQYTVNSIIVHYTPRRGMR